MNVIKVIYLIAENFKMQTQVAIEILHPASPVTTEKRLPPETLSTPIAAVRALGEPHGLCTLHSLPTVDKERDKTFIQTTLGPGRTAHDVAQSLRVAGVTIVRRYDELRTVTEVDGRKTTVLLAYIRASL